VVSRRRPAGAARGAKSFLTETISRVRHAGATGQLTVRADSAFYSNAVLGTATKLDDRFSVTVRQNKKIREAIDAIDEQSWTPIPYWLSTPEVSGPVHRWNYHAFVTDRDGALVDLEADHRRHAIVEQSIAELKSTGLAHLPSGRFTANAAWLALTVMAHNLGRAVDILPGHDLTRATAASLQRKTVSASPDDSCTPHGGCIYDCPNDGHRRPRSAARVHHRDPRALLNNNPDHPPRPEDPRRSR
jgi:hypothetical protein